VEGVTVCKVDENRLPVPGTEMNFDCDTVLLSVGLIPENELGRYAGVALDGRTNGAFVYDNMETSIPGIFACGNVVHVHDLVDFVSAEGERAGEAAADFVQGASLRSQFSEKTAGLDWRGVHAAHTIEIHNGADVGYTVPQFIRAGEAKQEIEVFFRVKRIFQSATVRVSSGDKELAAFRRVHMAPGEMEHIKLNGELLKAASKEITVAVIGAEEK
jgi:pyruvate/2-oxoglutarate dehydrogenase complex dihydrolipoamide dehydrogenase (E3) component